MIKKLALAVLIGTTLAVAQADAAGFRLNIGIGIPLFAPPPRPVYVAPPPVYVRPVPVYVAPPPLVVRYAQPQAVPVYVSPAPVPAYAAPIPR